MTKYLVTFTRPNGDTATQLTDADTPGFAIDLVIGADRAWAERGRYRRQVDSVVSAVPVYFARCATCGRQADGFTREPLPAGHRYVCPACEPQGRCDCGAKATWQLYTPAPYFEGGESPADLDAFVCNACLVGALLNCSDGEAPLAIKMTK